MTEQDKQNKISGLATAIVNKVTSLISTHNNNNTAHSDIRETLSNKQDNIQLINSKNNLTDGIYFFYDDYQLTISADNQIITTSDTATITAKLTFNNENANNETLLYTILDKNNNTLDSGSETTDNNGEISFEYEGTGAGDITIIVKYDSFLQETYELEDLIDYISGQTDELSKFGSSIGLRNSGSGTITYDSTNKYYKWTNNKNNSESFIPISSATGQDEFTIEFDANVQLSGIAGLVTYHDNSNWLRLSNIYNKRAYYYMNNGSGSEQETNTSTITNMWLHYKFTISNDTITKQVYNGDTLVDSDSRTVSSNWFDSSTQYGIPVLWGTGWSNLTYLKNFKIKAL